MLKKPCYGLILSLLLAPFLALAVDIEVYPDQNNTIIQNSPDSNFGDITYLVLNDIIGNRTRILLSFDISAIPDNQQIDTASVSINCASYNGNSPAGKSGMAYRITKTDWQELTSTWNSYKTGSLWDNAGGDYVNPHGPMPANCPGWWTSFDIKNHVEFGYQSGKRVNILIKFQNEDVGVEIYSQPIFYSRTGASNHPKLNISYSPLGPPPEATIPLFSFPSFAETWTGTASSAESFLDNFFWLAVALGGTCIGLLVVLYLSKGLKKSVRKIL